MKGFITVLTKQTNKQKPTHLDHKYDTYSVFNCLLSRLLKQSLSIFSLLLKHKKEPGTLTLMGLHSFYWLCSSCLNLQSRNILELLSFDFKIRQLIQFLLTPVFFFFFISSSLKKIIKRNQRKCSSVTILMWRFIQNLTGFIAYKILQLNRYMFPTLM